MTGLQGLYSVSMNSTPKSSQVSPTLSVDECNVLEGSLERDRTPFTDNLLTRISIGHITLSLYL